MINVRGPDGSNLSFPDNTPEAEIVAAMGSHYGEASKDEPVTTNKVVRSAATGVPIVGGLLNKANAAINATVAPAVEPFLTKGPETLDQPSWGERYARSLELQDAQDKAFAEQHPVVDTTAKIAGGVASMVPVVTAAPRLMGAAGTVPQMVRAGAGSGAAISAADAAVRGEDILPAAAVGGGVGAAAPIVGQAIGAAVRAARGKPPVMPQNTVRVGNTEVPVSQSQLTGDAAQSAEEQVLARGGRGEAAQRTAQDFNELQNTRLQKATDDIAASLDPTGQTPGTAPRAAGVRVLSEASAAEARRLAGEGAQRAAVDQQGAALRTNVGGGVPPVASPFEAAEQVSAGVAARRNQRMATTKQVYADLAAEPGTFSPEVTAGLGEKLRTRINRGNDPVWVDPQSTGKANEALRILDQAPAGLFNNAAVPRNPVGPVAQGAAPSEASQAYGELIRMGVQPDRAQQAVKRLPGGDGFGGGALEPHDVAVPGGGTVAVKPKVVEAGSILTSADKGYDQSLQPRNRARAASSVQVNDIAQNLEPRRLGVSAEADRGAPIVGPDGMVESGNGRVQAIRQAYAENGPAAERYRQWLAGQGADIAGMKNPVLVRERATPMNQAERQAFTVSANQSATLSMSAPERALADSRALSPQALGLIRSPDLGAVDNRDFVRAFMQSVPQAERGALMTASGDLSAEGLTRVRNAVLAKAYGDSPVLARIAESTNDEVRSISTGLTAAAPEWASLRAAVSAGEVPAELDATAHLIDAVNRTARARGRGQGMAASQAQTDAFAQQSPESALIQRLFYEADGKKAASGTQVGNALRNYAQEASKAQAGPGLDLGLAPVTARDILESTAAKASAPKELAREVSEAAVAANAPLAAEPISEIGLKEMDSARKRLVTLFGDAKSTAIRTGDRSDLRAIGRILHEFDQVILEAFDQGRFSGDGEVAKRLLSDARGSHAIYRQTFTSRGAGDDIGRSVEKILGRYTDTALTPDKVAELSYGSSANPGGGKAAQVSQRLRQILGDTSPEWGAYKQGLVSHLIDVPEGVARSPAQTADRIDKFLTSPHGRILAQTVLSADERASLKSFADNLRATEPVKLSSLGQVDKAMARISGRDGSMPMSGPEVIDMLMRETGATNKQFPAHLVQRLRADMSPEGFTQVRQGVFQRVVEAGAGKNDFGPQALANRLDKFLASPLAQELYGAPEINMMRQLEQAYRRLIPVPGTTNPSGTAPMLAKIAGAAKGHIMAMLGAAHGGFPGLAVGYAGGKAVEAVAGRKGQQAAVRAFYGEQPRASVRNSRVPIYLSQGAIPAETGSQR